MNGLKSMDVRHVKGFCVEKANGKYYQIRN